MNHAGCLPSARAADRSAGALLCLPALGQGSQGTAKFPDPKDLAAYVQGKRLFHYIASDVPVRPPRRLQETYSMTENETTESEKYTQKVVCFSPAENSFSLLFFMLLFFAVKYAAINLNRQLYLEYFPLQQTIFKLSLDIHSITSETQSCNMSMQEKYFLPFIQPFSCFNEHTDLHIHIYFPSPALQAKLPLTG